MAYEDPEGPPPPAEWTHRAPYEESFVANYEDLTADQQRAFGSAITWLWGLAREQWEYPTRLQREPPWHMERSRHANTFLIDGARGAGKTIVLVKLLSAIRNLSPLERERRNDDDALTELYDKMDRQVRLVPLPMLDLKPFPDRHLILELGSSLLELVRWLESGEEPAARDPVPDELELGVHHARRAWKLFASAAALGFARTPEQKLDPSEYVAELQQASEKRTQVEEAFRGFVDEVVRSCTQHRDDPPALLVLPIDDADMHPSRTVQLLDLLRFLRHPRLAYVVTGDSGLFLDVLEKTFMQEPPAPMSPRVLPADVAEQALEKVLPRAHRAELHRLSPSQCLALVERELRKDTPELDGATEELLRRLRRAEYALSRALPRFIRGLAQQVSRLRVLRGGGAIAEFVVHLWRDALDSSPLSADQRQELRDAVTLETAARVRERLGTPQVSTDERHADDTTGLFIRLEPYSHGFAPSPTLLFQRTVAELVVRWSLRFVLDFRQTNLPDRAASAYALATAYAHDESAHRGMDAYRRSPFVAAKVLERSLYWPLPKWSALDQLLSFSGRWEADLPSVRYDDPDALARTFIRAVLHSLGREADLDWRSLGRAVKSAASAKGALKKGALKNWVETGLPLLAAPEYGLPVDVADEVFELWAGLPGVDDPAQRIAIRATDRRQARYEAVGLRTDAVEGLDRRSQHRWSRELGSSLRDLLGAFGIANWSLSHLANATAIRREELESLDRQPLATRKLRTVLQSMPRSDSNGALVVLSPLWRAVAGDPSDVRRSAGSIEVTPRARLVASPDHSQRIELPDAAVELLRAPTVFVDKDPARSLVYRICWDSSVLLNAEGLPFERTAVLGIPEPVVRWPAIRVRTSAGEFCWPAPAYPPLYMWEHLGQAWDDMLNRSVGVASLDHVTGAEWVLGLAVSWAEWGKREPPLDGEYFGRLGAQIRPVGDLARSMASTLASGLSETPERNRWSHVLKEWAGAAYVAFSTPSISGVTEEFAKRLHDEMDQLVIGGEPRVELSVAVGRRAEFEKILRARD